MKVTLKLRSNYPHFDGAAVCMETDYIPNENDLITMESDRLDPDEVDYMVDERQFFYKDGKVDAVVYVKTMSEVLNLE